MGFNTAVDNVLKALDMSNIANPERAEVIAISWLVNNLIVNPNLTSKALSSV
jgi:tetrahydromethanopterin S-methyltransferase subunit A